MRTWALPKADTYFASLMTEAGFQVDHLIAALRHVTGWRTAVDGGAHVGTWTAAMAARFAEVIAFEPAADTFGCLEKNMRGLVNVELHRAALGERYCYGALCDDPTRPGNTGARFIRANGVGNVIVRPLDDLGLDALDFLKLDVEGGELAALAGARDTILRCRPVIIMEVKRLGSGRPDPELAVEDLTSLGYEEVERKGNDRIYVPH